ncbi:MAG: UbiA-like polyprenyltransferase [Dehalococcoidia bacterium]|nr:UbiA-like polyprenyltransferase [Dehalococcoidia bacterium]
MTTPLPQAKGSGPIAKLRLLLASIRFEHSLFALPFAYMGMVLAARGLPTWWQLLWITVAMVAARTLAMSANRVIDIRQDRLNPRTASRALVTGALNRKEMVAMATVSLAVFVIAAGMLNTLALALAPVAAVAVVGYSYVKRFTWLTHFALGWADAIAPAGGWIGVSGTLPLEGVVLAFAVAMWVGGFDLFYACQDIEFDRTHGVHSIPRRFGPGMAFWVARAMHLATSLSLLALGLWMGLGFPYYVGWALASALLIYEHTIISPRDLSRLNTAFFNVNGYIGVVVLAFALVALYV